MLTRKHIKRHLNKISASYRDSGNPSSAIWQAMHDYVVKHYKRLDKGARAFTDEMFDEMDAKVETWLHSLPKGIEKKKLQRKVSMVRGERSPLPILYMDTPVLEAVIRHHLGQKVTLGNALDGFPFEKVKDLITASKLICPENNFHREVLQEGGARGQSGMDILRTLSDGLSFRHSQAIEDFQVFRALREFINSGSSVDYGKFWKDAFPRKKLRAIFKKRSTVAFRGGVLLPNSDGDGFPHDQGARDIRLRIRYNSETYNGECQLQKRSARHLRDLVRLGLRYRSLGEERDERSLEALWAEQKTDLPVTLWNLYGGSPQNLGGLATFFDSHIFRELPTMKVKREVWNGFSARGQSGPGRTTGHADIAVLSSLLPYADIMILGKQMTQVVRDLGLGAHYDTEIFSLYEGERILDALRNVPGAD